MKIVMLGASGSGKTTLAKHLSKKLNIPYVENSAGLIMKDYYKERLKDLGYGGNLGQAGVVNKSSENPEFGELFQRYILQSRIDLLKSHKNIICDRSPLDPIAYYINQCSHNDPMGDKTKVFLYECIHETVRNCDIIIRVPLLTTKIEANGSRVANYFFQKKIDLIMDMVLDRIINLGKRNPLGIHKVEYWEMGMRFHQALNYINEYLECNPE